VEDLRYNNLAIDYHKNLNFGKDLEAYLDVRSMVGIEQQRILSHSLLLS